MCEPLVVHFGGIPMVETVEHLPESATVEDAMERLYFLAKVERGLEQSAAGDTIAHEDIKRRFLG